jgi:hypothetical protein
MSERPLTASIADIPFTFTGLDVHKDSIGAGILEPGVDQPGYDVHGTEAANGFLAEVRASFEEDLWRATALDLPDVARTACRAWWPASIGVATQTTERCWPTRDATPLLWASARLSVSVAGGRSAGHRDRWLRRSSGASGPSWSRCHRRG